MKARIKSTTLIMPTDNAAMFVLKTESRNEKISRRKLISQFKNTLTLLQGRYIELKLMQMED